ncbi:MAG: FAD-dependent oxidoreductase [Lachnospiraceae bacterium]|nr:FAD-dependent oxidoreductase [Lachnospiraceae bacterium]
MYRISQIKIPINAPGSALSIRVGELLGIRTEDIERLIIIRRSVDARKKPDIYYVYTVDIEISRNIRLSKKALSRKDISKVTPKAYHFPQSGNDVIKDPPVIVGTGPAGLFCGLFLARAGYRPILIERGKPAADRLRDVEEFWKCGVLDPESNVQFGEGGAGTFSDGKLNTMVKDSFGRNGAVLSEFVRHGAPDEIRYINKPHLGTDRLIDIVRSIREEIISLGGQVRFNTLMKEPVISNGSVEAIILKTLSGEERLDCKVLVLACGHSARDTFYSLNEKKVPMEVKSFAVGLRVIHPRDMINEARYGIEHKDDLPAADYKLTAKLPDGRGVYSFCMCPGGFVVNASSEPGMTAVNGMSYSGRDSSSSNSAIIVTVDKNDFPGDDVLSGVRFQRELEMKAYELCKGRIPLQLFKDYKENRESDEFGEFKPDLKGQYSFGNLRSVLPENINTSIIMGMEQFGKEIRGFDRDDSVFAGVESRTSSPVRIIRDENCQSEIGGLYPCGEGAGYAGGITSAAMDGIRVAEEIAKRFKPF